MPEGAEVNDNIYCGDRYGRERCEGGKLPRHRHAFGYICVILGGRFVEAGDAGRFRAEPGDALVHPRFEAHLDSFGANGSDVLNLPLVEGLPGEGLVRVDDVDAVARIAETDPFAASRAIAAHYRAAPAEQDWPDRLAGDLRRRPGLEIGRWAAEHGLTPAGVSRGFRQVYGTSPARYRAEARARRAWRDVAAGGRSLADIAFDLGFADQSHMTRALTEITGLPPGKWRRQGQLGSRPA